MRHFTVSLTSGLLLVFCQAFAGYAELALGGEWEALIAWELPTGIWSIENDLSVDLAFDGSAIESRTVIVNDAWTKQDVELAGSIGSVAIESDLRFEPYKHRFKDWITEFEWEADALAVTLTSKLTRTTDWLILELEREWPSIDVDARARMRAPSGSCGLLFHDADLGLEFEWCGIDTEFEIAIEDDGFDEAVLELKDVIHPRIPWAAFDLEIARTLTSTTVELSPELTLTTPWCAAHLELEFDGELPNAPSLFPLTIGEVHLEFDAADWEIDATATADPGDWIDDLYWLELETETEIDLDSCGKLAVGIQELWTPAQLGKAVAEMTYEPTEEVTLILSGTIDCIARQIEVLKVAATVAW